MLLTYRATLRGNQLKWHEAAPPTQTEEVTVLVTILGQENTTVAPETRGQRMAAALEKLAALADQSITDPVVWEREQRQERPLPYRS
jgi:hypothetical protein